MSIAAGWQPAGIVLQPGCVWTTAPAGGQQQGGEAGAPRSGDARPNSSDHQALFTSYAPGAGPAGTYEGLYTIPAP